MKVTGTGTTTPSASGRPVRAAGGEGFRIVGASAPAPAAQVSAPSGVSGVMGLEALLALQDIESPTERRRRSVRRAGRLLDELDDIKIALLGGELDAMQLNNLARAIHEQRSGTDDPTLEGLLDEIETRAAVELAKLEVASRAA